MRDLLGAEVNEKFRSQDLITRYPHFAAREYVLDAMLLASRGNL